jgi:2-deoxy-D-gluconate 3-dehydrogenase
MPMAYRGFDLSGQVVLVTGAAMGIGQALARGLAEAGATVAVTDLAAKLPQAEQLCEEIRRAGGRAQAFVIDVCDTAAIAAAFQAVVDALGPLRVLVNNAGTGIRKPAFEVEEADWDRIVDLNLKAQFFCAQAAARLMLAQGGGRIINVCSTHAMIAVENGSPYIASKGGVAALTRSLALEWIRHGIHVNAIAPGPVGSDYRLQLDAALGRTPEDVQRDMQARVPLGRRLDPQELVGATVYLASPAASAMVGHVLVVDGGQLVI